MQAFDNNNIPNPVDEDPCNKELSTMDLINTQSFFGFQNEGNGIMFSIWSKKNITITGIDFAKSSRSVGPVEIITEIYTSTTRPNFL